MQIVNFLSYFFLQIWVCGLPLRSNMFNGTITQIPQCQSQKTESILLYLVYKLSGIEKTRGKYSLQISK